MIHYNTKPKRLDSLVRFAIATSILNLAGQISLGFEMPWIQYVAALMTSYATELFLETIRARYSRTPVRYGGGVRAFITFLLPAHISGMTIAMLLYSGDLVWPIIFAATLTIASKYIFQVRIDGRSRHFLNPSNTGIALTCALFGEITVAAPWQFLSHTSGGTDLILPLIILISGSLLNLLFTRKIPLVAGWLLAFVGQAVVRHVFFDENILAILFAATGPVALLFTFYMVSDPGSTPSKISHQLMFGLSVGAMYGVFTICHITYGLFWGLLFVCLGRGMYHWLRSLGQPAVNQPTSQEGHNETHATASITGAA